MWKQHQSIPAGKQHFKDVVKEQCKRIHLHGLLAAFRIGPARPFTFGGVPCVAVSGARAVDWCGQLERALGGGLIHPGDTVALVGVWNDHHSVTPVVVEDDI